MSEDGAFTDTERLALWDAINAYTRQCGGNTGTRTVSVGRMKAVVDVERAVVAIVNDNRRGARQ